jgi:hypothetical protein
MRRAAPQLPGVRVLGPALALLAVLRRREVYLQAVLRH